MEHHVLTEFPLFSRKYTVMIHSATASAASIFRRSAQCSIHRMLLFGAETPKLDLNLNTYPNYEPNPNHKTLKH